MTSANAKPPSSFTGRGRQRKTHWTIFARDFLAKWVITVGGIGTIAAVLGVCVFLVWMVLPLFMSASVGVQQTITLPQADRDSKVLQTLVDEYGVMAAVVRSDASVDLVRVSDGGLIEKHRLVTDGPEITSISQGVPGGDIALGFADGSVRLGRLSFVAEYLPPASLPEEVRNAAVMEPRVYKGGVMQRTPQHQYRLQRMQIEFNEPIELAPGSPIVRVAAANPSSGPVIVAMTADGKLTAASFRSRTNMVTGETVLKKTVGEVPYKPGERSLPDHLFVTGPGDNAIVLWGDGHMQRYDITRVSDAVLAEEFNLVNDTEVSSVDYENLNGPRQFKSVQGSPSKVTSARWLLGRNTLLVGDSRGQIGGWFRIKPTKATTPDSVYFVRAHTIIGPASPVTSLAASTRNRIFAAGFANGSVQIVQMTSQKLLARIETAEGRPIDALAIAPEENQLVAAAGSTGFRCAITPVHPETTIGSLFGAVWYEGYARPDHSWQSTGGSDEFEPKLGLVPLVFGTIKATVYSMFFGAPIALLAALYTSEFMHPRTKSRVKPVVEMMASLPSVVLGFIVAVVMAPFVNRILPQTLACMLTVPFAFLLGAQLWQLVPQRIALKLQSLRFGAIFLCLPFGLALGFLLGRPAEVLLFGGDVQRWLNGTGSPVGGWVYVLIPVSAVFVALVFHFVVTPMVRHATREWSRERVAVADLVKFFVGLIVTLALAVGLAFVFSLIGDTRHGIFGAYTQRNALLVGFVMGFAIIPIIYTIAEDALSAVPAHLRSASLGAGATPWQTAVRIVVPTAMSGLFSAVMVGLGRAVGETMIVLMATGNTPIREWNVFSGFRTLSANIAVEMPEAVKGSTHYRTLFLAGLVLFGITLLLNTVAEIVRLRFRKRAFQL